MQRKILFTSMLAVLLLGCKEQASKSTERIVNVGTIIIKEEILPTKLTHNGILSAKELKNAVFKVPGRINKIHVSKGEKVKAGQLLVSLKTSEYQLAYDNAILIQNIAKQAYDEANSFFDKLSDAKKAGGISQTDYAKARLDMNAKKADFEQAKVNTALQKQQLNDCFLKADMDGVILDIYPLQGELVDAGTLILHIKNNYPIAEISVSSNELEQITIHDTATVNIGKSEYNASVFSIAEIPNFETFTYPVQLAIEGFDGDFYVGMPVSSSIYTGSNTGIRIPITAICSDGEDYVFCVSNGRAVQKSITKTAIHKQLVHVNGLSKGDTLITKGIKNVQAGIKTTIKN